MTNYTKPEFSLTEEEISFVKATFTEGVINPTSIVAKLYSKGNNIPFTSLKRIVLSILNIKETFKSIADTGEVTINIKE